VLRFFQFVILVLALSLVALASAIVTMRFAIHGAEVTVPSFKGLTAEEALNKAANLGVEITIDNRFYSADVPAGRILSQSPAAGTVVRREWHVRVTESLGPQLVQIPNLVGQPERAASIQIRRVGLQLGSVAEMPFDNAAPGTVIAQDPPAGAAGVEKPSVGIVVSQANVPISDGFVMPNLIGQQFDAAMASAIRRAGLKLAAPIQEAQAQPSNIGINTQTPGTVADQKPAAGYRVDGETLITLTVSR
jgi:beta-lactam-binding protein with PASTA domain